MVTEKLAAVVFAWLVQVAPPEKFALIPTYAEATETVEERTARYVEISRDIAHALEPLPPKERKGAAELLVSIAWHESGLQKDVDLGPCAPKRLKIGGCDGGRAKSLWQIQGRDEETKTRVDAARMALRIARVSLSACKKLPVEERLAIYASGTCVNKMGQKRSREIWSVLKRIRAMPALTGGGPGAAPSVP